MKILNVKTERRKFGDKGERLARALLRLKGYRILEKNYVAKGYEIDIIAKKRNVLAFVEVKTRNASSLGLTEPRPASSVTPDKQIKILKAANHYKYRFGGDSRMRFDVIEVIIDTKKRGRKIIKLNHLENTFDADTAAKVFKRKEFL